MCVIKVNLKRMCLRDVLKQDRCPTSVDGFVAKSTKESKDGMECLYKLQFPGWFGSRNKLAFNDKTTKPVELAFTFSSLIQFQVKLLDGDREKW